MPDADRRRWLFWALLLLALWLPRGSALDRYVTDDERRWLNRSGNFYQALVAGDYAATYQREHPGVTVMWAGTLGYLALYPGYAQDAPGQVAWDETGVEPTVRAAGREPLALLAAGRRVLATLIVVVLLLAFGQAAALFGFWPAWLGMMLVAFDPFHIALSRLLHLDVLSAGLLLLALLALLGYAGEPAFRRRRLLLSAVAAGLAWLTKSPGFFLLPFAALILAQHAWRHRSQAGLPAAAGHALGAFLLWLLVAAAVYVLLWPAMWVAPLATLGRVLATGAEYAAGQRLSTLFFNGRVLKGDPGLWFYPVNYLWRTTPVVLLGLPVVVWVVWRRAEPLATSWRRTCAGWLALFALLYALALTPSIQKFDRYLLPVFPPLDLLAGLGWAAVLLWIGRRGRQPALPAAAAGVVLLAQLLWVASTHPYYLSYFNPLLGGSRRAPQMLMIGRGEGLDLAADYLNALPDAAEQQILLWSQDNIGYLLEGQLADPDLVPDAGEQAEVDQLLGWLALDYVLLYVHQWQRQLIEPYVLDYLATKTPAQRFWADGLEYARLYAVKGEPAPAFLRVGRSQPVEWGERVRLVGYVLPEASPAPGDGIEAIFLLQSVAPMRRNLNLQVRIVGRDGAEIGRSDGWPWGRPTRDWPRDEVWPHGETYPIPADAAPGLYRVELSIDDPETLDPLSLRVVATGEALTNPYVVDYITVGPDLQEALPVTGVDADFGRQLAVTVAPPGADRLPPGAPVTVDLSWQAVDDVAADYTAFLHLIGPDGVLAAQQDRAPAGGFLPTGLWRPGLALADQMTLTIPSDAAPGDYRLQLGLYDARTGERLPRGDAAGATAIDVASLRVETFP